MLWASDNYRVELNQLLRITSEGEIKIPLTGDMGSSLCLDDVGVSQVEVIERDQALLEHINHGLIPMGSWRSQRCRAHARQRRVLIINVVMNSAVTMTLTKYSTS